MATPNNRCSGAMLLRRRRRIARPTRTKHRLLGVQTSLTKLKGIPERVCPFA